ELVADPVFEASRIPDRPQPGVGVAHCAANGLDDAERAERVERLQRVGDVAAGVVDAREAPAAEELVAEDLSPGVLDLLVLGEEAVAADVEAVAVVLHRAGQPADVPLV